MSNAADILKKCNSINQEDALFKDMVTAIGSSLDVITAEEVQAKKDFFFDTCSETQLKKYEKEAGISPVTGSTLDDRRYALEAKWISDGKCDVALLQSVANSWEYGKTNVDFTDNKIQVAFVDTLGVPDHVDRLKSALNEVKPAHLPIYYIYNYLLLSDVMEMTVDVVQAQYINEFAF